MAQTIDRGIALQAVQAREAQASRRRMIAGLAICGLGLLFTYRATLADLWSVWMENQDYSHGVLVAPFAAYLVWRRRGQLRNVPAKPSWLGLAILASALVMRLVALRYYYGSLESLSLVVTVWGLIVLIAGWQFTRRLTGPLLFLVLMVPPPQSAAAAITMPLQRFAASTSTSVLDAMGWRVVREGNVLRLPLQSLEVAEACSGLRMVFAVVTLGAAMACLLRRPVWERAVLVVSTLAIGVLVNVARVVITGVASELSAAHLSVSTVHDWAGWLMMPVAVLILWWEQRFLRLLFQESTEAQA